MTVRFLDVVESSAEGFPFMPGQVIHLAGFTPEVKRWLKQGVVEVVRDERGEEAVVETHEQAVVGTGKRRK